MPIIKTDGGYIYKKISKNTKTKKVKFLFLLFLCSVLIFAGCFFIFSKFDIIGAINLNKYLLFDETKFFAVSLNSGDEFSSIAEEVNDVKLHDGAGYVIKYSNIYHLIANIYSTKNDAESVLKNNSNFEASILEIKLNKMIIAKSFSSEEITALKHSLALVNRAYERLYQICVSLDRGEILDAEAKQKLQVFKETCQEEKESFNHIFQNNFESIVSRVKIFQSEVISNLSMILISQNTSSDIKYAIASIIDNFITLQKTSTRWWRCYGFT